MNKYTQVKQKSESKLTKDDKKKPDFAFPGISINMGVNSFLLTFTSVFIMCLFIWSHGWGHSITNFFLYLSIALLVFSFWFPYSSFVKRQVEVNDEYLRIRNRTLHYREIREIICDKNGTAIEFHLAYTKEPIQIRPENEFQLEVRDYFNVWCAYFDIPFTEKGKDN